MIIIGVKAVQSNFPKKRLGASWKRQERQIQIHKYKDKYTSHNERNTKKTKCQNPNMSQELNFCGKMCNMLRN